jgi:hypothetical protein
MSHQILTSGIPTRGSMSIEGWIQRWKLAQVFYDWQTLIAGVLALLAGFGTVAATMIIARRQITASREEADRVIAATRATRGLLRTNGAPTKRQSRPWASRRAKRKRASARLAGVCQPPNLASSAVVGYGPCAGRVRASATGSCRSRESLFSRRQDLERSRGLADWAGRTGARRHHRRSRCRCGTQ